MKAKLIVKDRFDFRHYHDKEELYRFKSIDRLFEDFYKDVRRFKNEG